MCSFGHREHGKRRARGATTGITDPSSRREPSSPARGARGSSATRCSRRNSVILLGGAHATCCSFRCRHRPTGAPAARRKRSGRIPRWSRAGGLSSPADMAAEGLAARSSAALPRPSTRLGHAHRARSLGFGQREDCLGTARSIGEPVRGAARSPHRRMEQPVPPR